MTQLSVQGCVAQGLSQEWAAAYVGLLQVGASILQALDPQAPQHSPQPGAQPRLGSAAM